MDDFEHVLWFCFLVESLILKHTLRKQFHCDEEFKCRGSHSNVAKDTGLLVCDTVFLGEYF